MMCFPFITCINTSGRSINEKTAISGGSTFSFYKAHPPFNGTNHRSFYQLGWWVSTKETTPDVVKIKPLQYIRCRLDYLFFSLNLSLPVMQ